MAAEYDDGDEAPAAAALVHDYDASELAIASEFLTNWLPFFSRGLCPACSSVLRHRILSLRDRNEDPPAPSLIPTDADAPAPDTTLGDHSESMLTVVYNDTEPSRGDDEESAPRSAAASVVPPVESSMARMSWADMAQEDQLAEEEEVAMERALESCPSAVKGGEEATKKKMELTRDQREMIRFRNVGRKKDFICLERVKGKIVNILDGLELHTGVFSAAEQKRIVDFVYELQEKGRNHQLRDHTYSEPVKWMKKGKGRGTLQFGCCYNYATDKDGNPPGILKSVVADPIPPFFKGNWLPPHIDSHDFTRPFCTVSLLSECSILFGSNLKFAGAGEFIGSSEIFLPIGSVLVLNGNGADIAKHCVPSVPAKRISITFRKMDEAKWPIGFTPEADLKNIQPLTYSPALYQEKSIHHEAQHITLRGGRRSKGRRTDLQWSELLSHDQSASSTSVDRGRNSFQKTITCKPHLCSRATQSHQDVVEDHANITTHDIQHEEGNGSIGSRRIRMKQQRILISRNLEEEETYPRQSGGSHNISRLQIETGGNGRRRVRELSSDEY